MVCFRSRRHAVGFLACIALLGACGGKKEEGAAGGGGGGGGSPASNSDLDVIPADSDTVFGIDLVKAQQSPLFKEYVLPQLTKSADAQKVLALLKEKCNIDPLASATRLTGGVKIAGRRLADGVVVLHGIEKAKALPCVDQMKDQLAAEQIEATKDGDVVIMKGAQGQLAITFTGEKTAVVAMGSKATKEGVLELAQGKSPLKSSKEFADMYGKLQSSHTTWFLVRGDQPALAKVLSMVNVQAKGIFGTVNTTDKVELNVYVRAASEEQAAALADLAKNQGGAMAGRMMEKFEVSQDKTDMRTVAVMTPTQIKSLMSLLPMLGGLR